MSTTIQLSPIEVIRQKIGTTEYCAEQLLQQLIDQYSVLETSYADLHSAAYEGCSGLMIESDRVPELTKRRLEHLASVIMSLPSPATNAAFKVDATNTVALDVAMQLWDHWFRQALPDWKPEHSTSCILLQISSMVSMINKCCDDKTTKIKFNLIDAVGKLLAAMVGSCTCGNQAAEYQDHADNCSYRLLHECYTSISSILDEMEQNYQITQPSWR